MIARIMHRVRTTVAPRGGGRHRLTRPLALLLALALVVAGATGALGLVAAQDAAGPSVAGPDAAVIAHAVATLPPGQIAWQLVRATAPLRGQGQPATWPLGFALGLGPRAAVLLTDQTTGARTRLANLEAAFVPAGATQRRESLGSVPAPYDEISLVPAAQAHVARGGPVLFASAPFAAPAGARDLDLVKGRLTQSDPTATYTTAPGVPLLVLPLQGALSVATGQGGSAAPLVGPAALAGTVTLRVTTSNSTGATYVAGIIGPAIPPSGATATAAVPATVPATAVATAPPATAPSTAPATAPATSPPIGTAAGTLTVDFAVDVCPPGDTITGTRRGFAGRFCERPDGSFEEGHSLTAATVILTNVGTGQAQSGQTDATGHVQFAGLPPGTYRASIPGAARAESICGAPPTSYGDIVQSAVGIALPGGFVACVADTVAAAPGTAPAASTASLALVATTCPPGYTGQSFASDCTTPLAGTDFTLQPEGGASAIEATGSDGSAHFASLAAGTYTLTENAPPMGVHADCADAAGNSVPVSYPSAPPPHPAGIGLQLAVGAQVTCHWYARPMAAAPGTAPAGTAPAGSAVAIAFTVRACPAGDSLTSLPRPPAAPACLTPAGKTENSSPAAGIEVDLIDVATGSQTSGTTDASGHLSFGPLIPDRYRAPLPTAVAAQSECEGPWPAHAGGLDIVNSPSGIAVPSGTATCTVDLLTAPPAAATAATTATSGGTALTLRPAPVGAPPSAGDRVRPGRGDGVADRPAEGA